MLFTENNPPRDFFAKFLSGRWSIKIWCLALASVLFLFVVLYFSFFKASDGFRSQKIITIKENSSLNEIANDLYARRFIISPFWFRALVIIKNGEQGVLAGDYLFQKPANLFTLTTRLTRGDFGLTPVKITFPEGMTVSQMADLLEARLINFDSEKFVKLAKPNEGYFFPDTYLFLPNAKSENVIEVFKKNFSDKIKTIEKELATFKKPLKDVVIMASIIEAEARTEETRRTIAGILWKRLSLGIPLQVDAPFEYIIKKNTFQLTTDDLKIDSPYNTYKYKGLPPTAIGNPGLSALRDAIMPIKSPYFYYLSDIRGAMHYAKTYSEHLLNKEEFINN